MATFVLFYKDSEWYLANIRDMTTDAYGKKENAISFLTRCGYNCLSNPSYSTQFWGK
jgi:hypothetical protein